MGSFQAGEAPPIAKSLSKGWATLTPTSPAHPPHRERAVHTDQVSLEKAREAGPVHVGHQLWRRLGLEEILEQELGRGFAVSRVSTQGTSQLTWCSCRLPRRKSSG